MQAYWFIPKTWRLDEFDVKDGIVSIRLQSGKSLSFSLSELKVRFQKDSYDRREFYLQHGKEKLHFKEIPGTLEKEEWDTLFAILESASDTGETTLGMITRIGRNALGSAENIVDK